MSTPIVVSAKEFDVRKYIGSAANKMTSFTFKEAHIEKLPLVTGGVVDLYDVAIEASEHQGYRLVLRLSKLKKTFYIINKKRKITEKIGTWMPRGEDGQYPEGFIGLAEVRNNFKSLVAEKEITKDDTWNVADMSIRDYLTSRYQQDRLKTTIKTGQLKPVRIETINGLLSVFTPWLDKKVGEAKSNWPQDFKDYWLTTPRYNPSTHVTTTLKTESMRKYYAALNAMFGVCVKRGYIAKNQIDGFTHLFERTKSEGITVYDYDYHEVLSFIFSKEVNEKLGHKLIVASMIVTGARNAEIFKNYSENFRTEKREVFIPGSISKNKNVSRVIPVESDLYWNKIVEYLSTLEPNEYGHMFPSKKAKNGHVTDIVYRQVWDAVKTKFNLKPKARLYNNRSTYGTRLAKEHSIDVAAKMLGDTLETTAKYYLHHDTDAARGTLQKLFNGGTSPINLQSTDTHEPASKVMLRVGKMPPDVDNLFQQFLGGKEASVVDGKINKETWAQFKSKISARIEKGKASAEEMDWFEIVS
jgi:integrase